jgi:bifunctional non-homologous end joining protein LigD
MATTLFKSADLYFKAGSSDKVYHATIENSDGGYVVNFKYGRRGSALKSGTKTNSPVSLEKATDIFEKLIKEKTGKGYQNVPNANSQEIHVAENPPDTPVESKCFLLNPIEEEEAAIYIVDKNWIMQEKLDGVRFLLEKKNSKVNSYNRRGLFTNIPTNIWNSVSEAKNFLIDGELIGEKMYAFDLLEYEDFNLRNEPLSKRLDVLKKLIDEIGWKENIDYVNVFETTEEKRDAYQKFLSENREGVVFKKTNAKYYVGRPASGGDYIKCKFYSTCSAIVTNINNKRSVSLGLYKGNKLVNAGNVTISSNFKIPEIGNVVEVKYLYAIKQSGSLYQPIYLGVRNDVVTEECTQKQLKFKSEED